MFGVYAVVLAVPPLRSFFELTILRPLDYALIAAVVTVWALLLRFIWRRWRFELVLDQTAS
jgi:cation-transporting ATPase E